MVGMSHECLISFTTPRSLLTASSERKGGKLKMIRSREDLGRAQRVVLKAGTSTVSSPDGFPSLVRLASLVEQASKLIREGKEVILITSGAVGVGRQKMKRQGLLRQTMGDMLLERTDSKEQLHGGE